MDWFAVSLLTVFAFGITQAVYAISQAIVGWWVGATVECISIGFGPVIFGKTISGVVWQLSAIPVGSYTKFLSDDAESDDGSQVDEAGDVPRESFSDLTIPRRAAISLIGPMSLIVIGLICMVISILAIGDQVVVDRGLPQQWNRTGVPHLTVAQAPSTWGGQKLLFESTVLEYSIRVVTLASLNGWGGFIGWASTLGSAGLYSWTAWATCFGVTVFGLGLANLLPIPCLNGGHLVFLIIEFALGKRPENFAIMATYVGMLFLFLAMSRMILADIAWLIAAF